MQIRKTVSEIHEQFCSLGRLLAQDRALITEMAH